MAPLLLPLLLPLLPLLPLLLPLRRASPSVVLPRSSCFKALAARIAYFEIFKKIWPFFRSPTALIDVLGTVALPVAQNSVLIDLEDTYRVNHFIIFVVYYSTILYLFNFKYIKVL